jgi:hypothetical protein
VAGFSLSSNLNLGLLSYFMHRCRELENFCDYLAIAAAASLAGAAATATGAAAIGAGCAGCLHAGVTIVVAGLIATIIHFLLN